MTFGCTKVVFGTIVGFTTGVDFGAELAAGGGGGGGGGGGAAWVVTNARIARSSAATLCVVMAPIATMSAMIAPCTPREATELFQRFPLPLRSLDDSMRLLCRSIRFLLRTRWLFAM